MKPADTSWQTRLIWFFGLWLAGVLAVSSVSFLIRLVLV